ncbi:MAG: hypothetical protein V2J62_03025 [candidate division KSB1 bacterium]|nr:hypothetical protein [candidate division KSB1 bacterium]
MAKIALVFALQICLIFPLLAQTEDFLRIDRTNPNYSEGDWVSYSVNRWSKSLVIGMEYIYTATTGGIGRYNHYINKWDYPFTSSNGLSDNDIFILAYDMDTNYLWCVTTYSLSCYFSTFRRWENYYFDDIGLGAADEIISIGFDDQSVWLETASGNLLRGNKYGGYVYERVMTGRDDRNSSIRWFGYRDRFFGRAPNFFMSDGFFFDSDGFITDMRFNRYYVSSLKQDNWGAYWVTVKGLGLGKADVNIEQLEILDYGLFIEDVSAIALNEETNELWVGGLGEFEGRSGITLWEIDNRQWSYYESRFITDLYSDQVTSIEVDGDYVWFGTTNGVARYERDTNDWRSYDVFSRLADNYVYDVETDSKNIWIASAGGLTKMVKSSLDTDSLDVEQIMTDDLRRVSVLDIELMENLVWLGTEDGVYVYDTNKNIGGYHDEPGGPMNEIVYAISRYENELWFALENGVEVFDVDRKVWLGPPQRRFYSGETVISIVADEAVVWAGTNRGVLKYDRDRETWIQYTREDGLLSDMVNVILPDGDYVWFGTPRGLTRFYWNAPNRID